MDDQTEIASLREEVASLRADLAAMRPAPEPAGGPISRRGLLMGVAGAGVAGVASLVGTGPAGAADGDALLLGQDNGSVTTTSVDHAPDGESSSGAGLFVRSTGTAALYATTVPTDDPDPYVADTAAIVGRGHGLLADNTRGHGVWGTTEHGFGVVGFNESGAFPAAFGQNKGIGPGVAGGSRGHGPQLYLVQEDAAPVGPTPGYADPGYVRLDASCDLWLCVVGQQDPETGPPATWTRLLREDTAAGRVIPIAPLRAIDTRAPGGKPSASPIVPGQKAGPLKGGASLTLDLAGADTIPAAATGVVGNLTVVSPTFSGFLTAQPSAGTAITSSLNFPAGVAAIANGFTSGLGPAGLKISASGSAANQYHLVVDITAYIT